MITFHSCGARHGTREADLKDLPLCTGPWPALSFILLATWSLATSQKLGGVRKSVFKARVWAAVTNETSLSLELITGDAFYPSTNRVHVWILRSPGLLYGLVKYA